MFTPSSQQSAFFSELQLGHSSIILEAVAGAGKTTTIVQGASLISPHVLTVFLAFNKRIAEELSGRLPSHVQCSTFHSRALSALKRSLPKSPKIDGDKVRAILKENLEWKEFDKYGQFVTKLVSLAKSAGIGVLCSSDSIEWENLITHFSLTLDSPEADLSRAIFLADKVLEESNRTLSVVDFDDMLYLALLRKVTFDKASFIFIDEAQDTNGVQRALLSQMGNFGDWEIDSETRDTVYYPGTSRLIAVGDPNQSIYGFRGADSSAMDLIKSTFSCKVLPLSVSFRCSKSVVKEAQKYL